MPRAKNEITVTVFPSDGGEEVSFDGVNYLSWINNDTFGIPAKIAEQDVKDEGLPVRVLYVNPENIAAVEAIRVR